MNFHAHREGKGDQAKGLGLRICGGSGLCLGEKGFGGAAGVLDQKVGQATGHVSAGTFGVEASVILADGGFGFFPQFHGKESGGIDQATFEGVLQIVAGVSDLVGEIDDLGLEGGVQAGAGKGVDALANFEGEVESVEFGVFDFDLLHDAKALAAATEAAGILHQLIESLLDRVAKGGVTKIPGEGNGLSQVFIQAEGATKRAGEGSDLDGVGQAGADMIA